MHEDKSNANETCTNEQKESIVDLGKADENLDSNPEMQNYSINSSSPKDDPCLLDQKLVKELFCDFDLENQDKDGLRSEDNYAEDQVKDDMRLDGNDVDDPIGYDLRQGDNGEIEKNIQGDDTNSHDNDVGEESSDSPLKDKFSIGKTFKTFPDFKDSFDEFCKKSFTLVYIRSSHKNGSKRYDQNLFPKKDISYQCKYFRDPEKIQSKGKNIRPQQSYCAANCEFSLSLILRNGLYAVKDSHLEHNGHPVGEQYYKASATGRKLSDKEKLFAKEQLIDMKNSVKNVKTAISNKFGKEVTNKDILNLRQNLKCPVDSCNDLEQTVQLLRERCAQDPGASLIIETEPLDSSQKREEIVKVIFFQDSAMKEQFQKYGLILFLDGTYSLNNKDYILIPILVVDNHNRHQLAAWAFVSNEKKEQIKSLLRIFKEQNPQSEGLVEYVIIDKDYSEINSISSVFHNASYVICRWHAIRAVERYVRKMHLSGHEQHIKKKLMNLFKRLVFEPTEKGYMDAWKEICNMKSNNPLLEKAKSYLNDNWHLYRKHFAYHILKAKPLQKNFTNNRSENFNKQLKDIITIKGSLRKAVEGLLLYAEDQRKRTIFRKTQQATKFFRPTTVEDSYEQEILKLTKPLITKEIQQKILSQYEKSLEFDSNEDFIANIYTLEKNQIHCPKKSEKCPFSLNWGLPCSHLLFIRKRNNELLIEKDMFRERWLTQISNQNFCLDSDIDEPLPCGEKEKSSKKHNLKGLSKNTKIKKRKVDSTQSVFVDENLNIVDPALGSRIILSPKKAPSRDRAKQQEKYYKKFTCKSSQDEFNDWYTANGVPSRLNMKDFEVFENSHAWLADIHMNYGLVLLKNYFGINIQGFFDTGVYSTYGFKSINPELDFAQPIHTGSSHWSLLTNIGVPQEERKNTVYYFDSMIKMRPGSMTRAIVPPAVEWQVCQLLRNTQESNYIIKIRPCSQQQNFSDCGLFALANCTNICFGFDVSETCYTGNLRSEFFKMLKTKQISPFAFEQRNQLNKHTFLVPIQGKIADDRIEIPKFLIEMITPSCHCRMTESYGDIVSCDSCEKRYHLKCYLMAGEVGKSRPKTFLCYNCRKENDYSFLDKASKIDRGAIEICSGKIANLEIHTLSRYCSEISVLETQSIPHTIHDFNKIESIISTYDLNQFCLKSGDIYVNFYNNFVNNVLEMPHGKQLHEYSLAQQMHLIILLICHVQLIPCSPLWRPAYLNTEAQMDLTTDILPVETALKKHKKFNKTIETTLDRLVLKIDKFKKKNILFRVCGDYYSEFFKEIGDLNKFVCLAINDLKMCGTENASSKKISEKEAMLAKLCDLQDRVQICKIGLENFHESHSSLP